MDELNALFNLDENLEILDKTVTEKYDYRCSFIQTSADMTTGSKPSTHKPRSSRPCRRGYERRKSD
jgi:hypothetical protein